MNTSRIYGAYQTIITMLGERKEEDEGFETDEMDEDDFIQMIEDMKDAYSEPLKFKRNEEKITVFYTPKLTEKTLKESIKSSKSKHLLYFFFDKDNKKSLDAYINESRKTKTIELFFIDELRFPLAHHVYIKPHRKLTQEEKQEIYDYYKIVNDEDAVRKLPILLEKDAVARYYNFKTFDLVVIDELKNPYIRIVFPNIKKIEVEKE